MKIHDEALSDVNRYLQGEQLTPEARRRHFEGIMRPIRRFARVDSQTRMLEVGTGTGWFPILCQLEGLQCRGIEISPQLIAYAREAGKALGVEPDIQLGNLEDIDLGESVYDVIVCSNVFEHVEHWQTGVAKVHRALKPGGMMFFESTNKFSFTSGEYSKFPLYGWLPDSWRYRLRIAVHGADIMKLGIDFHQFRHSQLRREFEKAGFSRILDRVEMASVEAVSSPLRRWAVEASRKSALIKALSLTFAEATRFACFK